MTVQVGILVQPLDHDPGELRRFLTLAADTRRPRRSRRQVRFLVGPKGRADRRGPWRWRAPCCRCATTARYLRPWFKSVVMAARVPVDQPSPDGISGARSTGGRRGLGDRGLCTPPLDHPLDHPDDPSVSVWSRLDRRGLRREQARSGWSRPDRRRAPGYGSGGWLRSREGGEVGGDRLRALPMRTVAGVWVHPSAGRPASRPQGAAAPPATPPCPGRPRSAASVP